jgi:hypothetical protein
MPKRLRPEATAVRRFAYCCASPAGSSLCCVGDPARHLPAGRLMTGLKASSSRRSAARALVAVASDSGALAGRRSDAGLGCPGHRRGSSTARCSSTAHGCRPAQDHDAGTGDRGGGAAADGHGCRAARPPRQPGPAVGAARHKVGGDRRGRPTRDGAFTIRMRAGALGRHTYRVATPDPAGSNAFRLRSATAVVRTLKTVDPRRPQHPARCYHPPWCQRRAAHAG